MQQEQIYSKINQWFEKEQLELGFYFINEADKNTELASKNLAQTDPNDKEEYYMAGYGYDSVLREDGRMAGKAITYIKQDFKNLFNLELSWDEIEDFIDNIKEPFKSLERCKTSCVLPSMKHDYIDYIKNFIHDFVIEHTIQVQEAA